MRVVVGACALIAVVSFALSASAQIDYARHVGVHPNLALALPVCLDALLLASGAALMMRRRDRRDAGMAAWIFWLAVAASVAVNALHGAPDAIEASAAAVALSIIPPLSLTASVELAIAEVLRAQGRGNSKKRGMSTKSSKPKAGTLDAPSNGHKRATGTLAKLTLVELERLVAEHGSQKKAADALAVSHGAVRNRLSRLRDLERNGT